MHERHPKISQRVSEVQKSSEEHRFQRSSLATHKKQLQDLDNGTELDLHARYGLCLD